MPQSHSFKTTAWLTGLAAGAVLLGTASAVAVQPETEFATGPDAFTELLRGRFAEQGEVERFTLEERMAHYQVPGVAVAIIDNGEVIYAEGFGVRQAGSDRPVTADSVFSSGSVSKVATALLALRQVQTGQLSLDEDIANYLEIWRPNPEGEFADAPLTLRMLMSHTAGLNQRGYGDYQPDAALPTLAQTLNGQEPAMTAPLEILSQPGARYGYSGGGYTLLQGIMAQAAGQSFETLAKDSLFDPLGMSRSTFANPLPEDHGDIAYAHDWNGEPAALPRGYEAMPELAASGLWASASDLAVMVAEMLKAYRGESEYLNQDLAIEMMTPVAPSEHGLGPRLSGAGETYLFHHGGANNSYRAWIEGHLVTGDGLVVMTNATMGMGLAIEIRNAVNDAMGWRVNEVIDLPELTLSEAHLDHFVGAFELDREHRVELMAQMDRPPFTRTLTIVRQEAELFGSYDGGENLTRLVPVTPNRFYVPDFNARLGAFELQFHRSATSQITSVRASMPGADILYLPAS
jgi:CubicO group peptidase (beta-lactamase class C family)